MYVMFIEVERNLILYPAVGLLMQLRLVDHWVNFAKDRNGQKTCTEWIKMTFSLMQFSDSRSLEGLILSEMSKFKL